MKKQLYRNYEPELLHRLQQTELEVLSAFQEICSELNLTYFLHFGGLIGVVRHGGFIPWDDDIDVAMPREDFNKFKAYCAAHPQMPYEYIDPTVNPRFTKTVPLFYKKGTVFATDHIGYQTGIGIDIFIYDYAPGDKKQFLKLCRKLNFIRQLYYLYYRDPVLNLNGAKFYLAAILCRLGQLGIRLLCRRPEKLYARLEAISQKAASDGAWMFTFSSSNPYRTRIRKEQFQTKTAEFEGRTVAVPGDMESFLKRFYGNYMEMPPEEKRVNHAPACLDFGEGDVFR